MSQYLEFLRYCNISCSKLSPYFSDTTVEQTFSVLNSVTECVNASGWFTVLEVPSSDQGNTVQCDWYPTGTQPYFLFVPGNQSRLMSGKYLLCSMFGNISEILT